MHVYKHTNLFKIIKIKTIIKKSIQIILVPSESIIAGILGSETTQILSADLITRVPQSVFM
jgi:hypothetical protein